ncbi:MAG TPA: LysR substrate-binding domain-containing protein [Chloroflexaceae bacterium]|nr:LysR substrate-binding domain-containing protein [Chloroflexaceae bacterium]
MELRHLIYFEAVARHEHVSKAALELMISQPAITKQLQDLERELRGGPLFERVGRRLRLTEAGRAFLAHTRTILAQVEAARAEMRERGDLHGGRVGIGAPPTVSERLLPEVLRRFHRDYPELELRVHEGSTSTLMTLLDSGEIELAVVTRPDSLRGLRVTELFSEPLVVVVERAHPLALAGRRSVTMAELASEPFLLYSPGGYVREATLRACREAGFLPRVVLDSGSMELLLRLAEAGLGLAVIPRLALKGDEQLAVIRLAEPVLGRTMVLVSREGRALSPAAQRLRDFLAERLARPQRPEV